MKKQILSLLAFCVVTASSAQMAITNLDFRAPVAPAAAQSKPISGTINAPTQGTNMLWDYSSVTTGTAYSTSLSLPDTTGGFSGTTGMSAYNPTFGPVQITGSKSYYTLNNSGYYYAGFSTADQAISIQALTGSPGDSLFFPFSSNVLGTSVPIYDFPLNYGQGLISKYQATTPFVINAPGYLLNYAPGELKQYVTRQDSVVGWGKLVRPQMDTLDVLLMKKVLVQIDSVFLYGATADPFLLAQFNMTQGNVTMNFMYEFIAKGLERSAMTLYTDLSFTNVSDGDYSTEAAQNYAGIFESSKTALKVYPNPASDVVNIELNEVRGNITAEIYSMDGKMIASHKITANEANVSLDVKDLNAGTYFVKISGEAGTSGHFRLVKTH